MISKNLYLRGLLYSCILGFALGSDLRAERQSERGGIPRASTPQLSGAVSILNSVWEGEPSGPFGPGQGLWNVASYWNPDGVPNNSGSATYNVSVQHNPNSPNFFTGPRTDINIVINNLNLIDRGAVTSLPGTSFTVLGTTTISVVTAGQDTGLFQAEPGATMTLGTLTSYNAPSKTQNNTGLVSTGGTIMYHGADIVTNKAFLFMKGPTAALLNQDNSANALANLAVNDGGSLQFEAGFDFTSAGNFTNNGGLTVNAYEVSGTPMNTTFTVNGSLTNFNPTTHTLSGGFYSLRGEDGATAILRFANADIRTINTTVQLEGDSRITDLAGANAFRNLSSSSASTTLSGSFTITPAGGNFTNTGTLGISSSGAISVAGNYTQTAGSTTVSGGGSLNVVGSGSPSALGTMFCDDSIIAMGGTFGSPLVSTITASNGTFINNSSQVIGNGSFFSDLTFSGNSGFIPGFSAGQIEVEGNVTLNSAARIVMEVGGTNPGAQYDRIVQTGSHSFRLGESTLEVSFLNGFEHTVTNSDLFAIITSENDILEEFGNAASGARVATTNGSGSFLVTYGAGSDEPQNVVLSDFVVHGVASISRNSGAIVVHGKGAPFATHDILATDDLSDEFLPIGQQDADEFGDFEFLDEIGPGTMRRFYRVALASN